MSVIQLRHLAVLLYPGLLSGVISASTATGTLRLVSERPGSVVFVNEIKHGTTDDQGLLELKIKPGSYGVRVRTVGYVDWRSRAVVAANRVLTLRVTQRATSDEAELHYQKGDDLRGKGQHSQAVEEYTKVLLLRSAFPAARIGLARSLIALQRFDEAENQIIRANRIPGRVLVEAQTVLANMRRAQGLIDEAIIEYKKALRLARGLSPEAHIGLALAFEDAGRIADAIPEFRAGIAQDMDTEPILYYLLGSALEKLARNQEAVEAYRSYIRLAPEGQYASAVESMIERLK
jgi:tetratricopeptide (TPR) repeat protein